MAEVEGLGREHEPRDEVPQKKEIRRITVQVQPRQKVCKTPSPPIKSWVWWHISFIPATQEA
jgi:hypothetical protein